MALLAKIQPEQTVLLRIHDALSLWDLHLAQHARQMAAMTTLFYDRPAKLSWPLHQKVRSKKLSALVGHLALLF